MSNVDKYTQPTPAQEVANGILSILKGMREPDDEFPDDDYDIAKTQHFHLWGDPEYPRPPSDIMVLPDIGYHAIDMYLPDSFPKKRLIDAETTLTHIANRTRTVGSAEVLNTLRDLSKVVADELARIDLEIGDSAEHRALYAGEMDFYRDRFAKIDGLLERGVELGLFNEGQSFVSRAKSVED